jgi:hypothetical protein
VVRRKPLTLRLWRQRLGQGRGQPGWFKILHFNMGRTANVLSQHAILVPELATKRSDRISFYPDEGLMGLQNDI